MTETVEGTQKDVSTITITIVTHGKENVTTASINVEARTKINK